MSKRVLAVLACTALAAIGASIWVPVRSLKPGTNEFWDHHPGTDYIRIDRVLTWSQDLKIGVLWAQYLVPVACIAAVGGLLALVLRNRARRIEANT